MYGWSRYSVDSIEQRFPQQVEQVELEWEDEEACRGLDVDQK